MDDNAHYRSRKIANTSSAMNEWSAWNIKYPICDVQLFYYGVFDTYETRHTSEDEIQYSIISQVEEKFRVKDQKDLIPGV